MSVNRTISLENGKFDLSDTIVNIVELFCGIPSLVMMICFLFLMGFSKVYKNAFYKLVQMDLLINLLVYTNTLLSLRLELLPFCIFILKFIEKSVPGFLTWTKYFAWWFLHIQFLSAASLTVHRISAIYWPYKYDKFWSKYYLHCGLAFALYSFLPTFFWLDFAIKVEIQNETLVTIVYPEVLAKANNVTAIFTVLYFIIFIALGVMASAYFSKQQQILSTMHETVSKKLTRIAITYCIVFTGVLSWTVLTSLNNLFRLLPDFLLRFIQPLLLYSSDLMTLSLPYILLVFDSNVKRQILPKRLKKKTTVSTVMVVSH
ncbi:Serpentine receptor class gamma [Caenorhabditis elegans]|uniref:Serpentine receptor class gamma n=1 Tax=Caenorhabditis elegans TaxID=6239 RepID=Q86B40_CAEEL|nr:Serpentine receptor class gamma [Caenorhabditis elegans]CCD65540.1 Serpentine receptor class gamma [Caenorhabditis elegans]|eukprot:NP_872224.1 Serpentine receptor class gamma [Caenorhabditis elegans]